MENAMADRSVQYLSAACVSTATVTMGMASAWSTPVLPKLKGNETQVDIDETGISWMLAMGPLGFIIGSFVAGFVVDKTGRRATMLWSALPYSVGMIIVATARTSWLLLITFLLWNCGTGMLSNVMTLYFGEISDKDIRGRIFMITRITFNFGNLLMMCIGPFLSYTTLNYVMLVLPLCYFAACLWIPESPYYYLKEGKTDRAEKALKRLKGFKDEKNLEEELRRIQSDVKKEMRRSGSLKELLAVRKYRSAVIIAAGLKTTQILSGLMSIQNYLVLIMNESKITIDKATIVIIFGVVRFLVSILQSFLIDRLGRRPLLIFSYAGTSVSLAVVGVYFFLLDVVKIDHDKITPYGIITFIGILVANIVSTIGFQSLAQIIPGEIFPLNVKAVAMTTLSVYGGILGSVIGKGYQNLKDAVGLSGVFWLFASMSFIGAVFSYFCVPETKGKSLSDIQKLLQGDLYEDESVAKMLNEVAVNGDAKGDSNEGTELQELTKKDDK